MNIINGTREQLVLFLVLNVWASHSALPIMLFLVLSKRVQRHATFANLLACFTVVGISSDILLYAGKYEGPEPSKLLCLFQASLLYGMPFITSLAAFMLVLQMFIVIRASVYGQVYIEREHAFRSRLMIIIPYVAWLISIVATAAVGAQNPDAVSRDRRFFYCSVKSDPLTNTILVLAAAILLVTISLEVATVVLFYRKWSQVQQGSSTKALELNLPIRILSFGVYLAIAFCLSLLSVKSPQSPAPDLIIAFASTVVVVIFGTQKDILRALCFWKPAAESRSETSSINSTSKA